MRRRRPGSRARAWSVASFWRVGEAGRRAAATRAGSGPRSSSPARGSGPSGTAGRLEVFLASDVLEAHVEVGRASRSRWRPAPPPSARSTVWPPARRRDHARAGRAAAEPVEQPAPRSARARRRSPRRRPWPSYDPSSARRDHRGEDRAGARSTHKPERAADPESRPEAVAAGLRPETPRSRQRRLHALGELGVGVHAPNPISTIDRQRRREDRRRARPH